MSLLTINDKAGHYPASWYAATAEPLAPFPELRGELRADIAVVGGGFTGLSAALHAAQKGYDVVLVDAQRVGFGASGRNGGQVGTGQRLDQPTLEARYGDETARALWGLGLAAVTLVKDLITRHGIEAYWRDGIAHAGHTKAEGDAIRRDAEHLISAYDHPALELLDQGQMRAVIGSDALYGGAIDRMAGHIHPLRFAFGLAAAARDAGVRIFEQSQAHHVAPGQVRTARGRIQADSVIIAGNGYLAGLERATEARFMPINNYIIATEPLGPRAADILRQDVAVADSRFVVNYWRLSHDGRLLFGGGESYGRRFPADIAAVVRKPLQTIYPQLADVRVDYAWGGTLAITRSRLPIVHRPAPGLWAAGGYSGHGVALATLAGQVLAEAVDGDLARFDTMRLMRPGPLPALGPLRTPMLALAMMWYALRDRLGV